MKTLRTWCGISSSALAVAMPAHVVVASEFLSIEQAQRAAFPHANRFDEVAATIDSEQWKQVNALAGAQPQHGKLRIWRAMLASNLLGYFFLDEVIGRQDLITYTVAIDSNGRLSPIEILGYRESHGGEVRNSAWRKQFAGRSSLADLRFEVDIKNIAGATLSCEHVTQGVRRIVALWQTVLSGTR